MEIPAKAEVLVVGAGPTGLMLANQLARRGVRALIVDKNAGGVGTLFKKYKVESVNGHGRLTGPNAVEVIAADGSKKTLSTKYVLVSTGSVPREIKVAPSDGEKIVNSDHLLEGAAAIRCNNLPALSYKLERLLSDPERFKSMQANALRMGHPNAARDIVEQLAPQKAAKSTKKAD